MYDDKQGDLISPIFQRICHESCRVGLPDGMCVGYIVRDMSGLNFLVRNITIELAIGAQGGERWRCSRNEFHIMIMIIDHEQGPANMRSAVTT